MRAWVDGQEQEWAASGMDIESFTALRLELA